jgi:hypothetical protein
MLDQPHQSVDMSIEPLDDFVVVQPFEATPRRGPG